MALTIETSVFVLYVLLGVVAWVFIGLGMNIGRLLTTLIRPTRQGLLDPPPRVTILIPAKDEAERIRDCLLSALAQEYADYQVIAIDDRSQDATGAVMDQLAATHPRLRVVHIRDGALPPGWTGKCHALHTGMAGADGEWLLLVDSDVILHPRALAETVRVSTAREYDLLSLLPRLECHTLWETTIVPLAGTALSMLYLVALTNHRTKETAFANGQFILIRRSAYDAIGGHAAVRNRFCEDIEMARRAKARGLCVRIARGADLAAVRMYSSLGSIVRGWARIFFAASTGRPWRILLGMLAIVVCVYGAFVAGAWGLWRLGHPVPCLHPWAWLAAAGAHWTVMTVVVAAGYAWTRNARRTALLLPLSAAVLLGIFARALWMCLSGEVEWRGTRYSRAAPT